ncbi:MULTISPECIES: ATP-dependent helicase [unclassified Bradyrhizobium]|uniref:ATP-dependent helicase n=1 Tax=unclassified Bradyrhizobium TaxID=2631580 RepID=UPI0028E6B9C8|nr:MULTISPECIES: ATP-dependent helicase [unclassified Bradyrhizobium]
MGTVTRIRPTLSLDDEFANFDVREELERQLEQRLREVELDARPALKAFQPAADADQLSLIHAPHQTIRLIAPAGSGKTQTIINRVLHLAKKGTRPERILCLTFDNSAVRALREKVTEQLSGLSAPHQNFQISTLNAFGYKILRDHFHAEHKQIIEAPRVWRLIKELKDTLASTEEGRKRHDALPASLRFRFYSEFFGLLKNALFDPRATDPQKLADFMLTSKAGEVFFQPGSTSDEKKLVIQAVYWMFKEYERLLQRERRMDFDDQKLRAVKCLDSSPNVLSLAQHQFDEIIVDEFQDINELDFAFVSLIAQRARLVITGDDDQAIYGFRGCTPRYIIELEKYLGRQVESFELKRNYRCPRNIVDHATRLIRHNQWRVEKNPIAHRSDDASIKVIESTTATAEAKMIATTIERVRRRNKELKFSDFAVLYRTNAQSLPIQLQFILRGIPYNVREQDNILHNNELEKLLGVLRAKLALSKNQQPDPADAVLSLRSYFQYVDERILARLERAFEAAPSFFDVLASRSVLTLLPKLRESRFASVMQDVAKAPSLFKTLDILAKDFRGLRGMVGSLEDVIDNEVPLGEVYELAASFRGRVDAFVDTVDNALKRAKEAKTGEEQDGVALATYFKAKGLQWHTVILTSCNEGLIPHKRALVEDERRLFYVALTRASSNLIVSYLKTSCKTRVAASTFLTQAGLYG